MTNRRQFFSRLFGGIATVSVAPNILIPRFADKQIWRPRPQIIELKITSTPVVAKHHPRKLKAKWTFEMEQDMQFYHDIRPDYLVEVMGKPNDSNSSIPIEYNLEGYLVFEIEVGKNVFVDRTKRNGEEVRGMFTTSRVTEVGDNYFKTQNSVYSYKFL